MSAELDRINDFVAYSKTLKGHEKQEAHEFCDHLFRAFGHPGAGDAGAEFEVRVKGANGRTKFIDLVWRPRLLIEMKSRGERLQAHYRQAFDYWLYLVPERPKYVVLSNFDEFWIYDFNVQLDEPLDRVTVAELPDRFPALNFLFPDDRKPQFGNDRVAVTRAAADKVAQVFNSLVARGEEREVAQRFILQCVIAMFSEDFDLLPKGMFVELLDDCRNGQSTFDLIGGLFRQMNTKTPARGGRFQKVAYFNGGIFSTVEPLELEKTEIDLLADAASENWSKVAPPIFGTLFQSSMDKERRHAYGAHFTNEADIQKVVLPTIVRPWRQRIEATETLKDLLALTKELQEFRVLDPACGSGNFLYVAYRELVNLEMEVLAKIHDKFGKRARQAVGTASLVGTTQFYGIDKDEFAVELAKVTLMLGKRIALAETHDNWFAARSELPFDFEEPLPLDNLDQNIRCDDALFCDWPEADAIIGNPPYQSKNKMQQEFGPAYLNRLREHEPGVPGRADYCVYWFRRAHDELPEDGRAGLVGTNTIRQNYSREGGLDYIVENDGTITEAVSTQVWSGDAVVHVSIVNWIKGEEDGKKKLYWQQGDHVDSPWEMAEVEEINSSLTTSFDVGEAAVLRCNAESTACLQGQTHGHDGFLLEAEEGLRLLGEHPEYGDVLFPYLNGREIVGNLGSQPERFVIDFGPMTVLQAQKYKGLFERLKKTVLPTREAAAKDEEERNKEALKANPKAKVNRHHANFLRRWWCLSYARVELISQLGKVSRYIASARVTKRPIFVFVDSGIRPSDALQVFVFEDDYSFGILQSAAHWEWFKARCSTLKGDFRYTSNTVFDTFPWPQSPTLADIRKVAEAGRELRKLRDELTEQEELPLRDLYRSLELPGANPLKDAHLKLDAAVRKAYGLSKTAGWLESLLALNAKLAEQKAHMQPVVGPGLPATVKNRAEFVSPDCVSVSG